MWRKVRIYKCDICKIEKPGRESYICGEFLYKSLPDYWVGSEDKNGSCFCEKCAEAIKKVRKKENE